MVKMAVNRDSRRDFLRKVGMAGGAGALFATMGALDLAVTSDSALPAFHPPRSADFSLTGRGSARVAILGAGTAGLTCAYELGKAGYDCTVLEAQGLAGGRNLTVRAGSRHTDINGDTQTATYSLGQYFNAGPARIAQWMLTVDYCRELGVPLEMFGNVNADAYFYQEDAGMTPGNPVRRRAIKSPWTRNSQRRTRSGCWSSCASSAVSATAFRTTRRTAGSTGAARSAATRRGRPAPARPGCCPARCHHCPPCSATR
jgi:hypothetical protein